MGTKRKPKKSPLSRSVRISAPPLQASVSPPLPPLSKSVRISAPSVQASGPPLPPLSKSVRISAPVPVEDSVPYDDEETQDPNSEEVPNSLGPSTSTPGLEGCSDPIEDHSEPQTSTPTQGTQAQVLGRGEVHTINKDGVIGTRKVPSPADIWRIPEGEKVVLRCNRLGLPVGIAGMKFRRLGAKLVRTGKFCDFHTCDWRKVPIQQKQDIWDVLMQKFYVETNVPIERVQHIAFKDFGKKRKDFRHTLKQSLQLKECEKIEDVLQTTPNLHLYNADDIETTIGTWLTEKDRVITQINTVLCFTYIYLFVILILMQNVWERAEKNKERRGMQEFSHTLGSKSIARIVDERETKVGYAPTRHELFIETHTKSDGTPVNDKAKEKIDKMKELMSQDSPTSRSCTEGIVQWSQEDVYGQVMGLKILVVFVDWDWGQHRADPGAVHLGHQHRLPKILNL